MKHHSPLDRFFKLGLGILAWLGIIATVLWAAESMMPIVALFGLALVFTYVLLAPVNLMEKGLRKPVQALFKLTPGGPDRMPIQFPRAVAILLVYLLFAASMLVASVRLVPVVVEQLHAFSGQVPTYIHQGEDWLLNLPVTENYFHQEVKVLQSKGVLSKPQETNLAKETEGQPKLHPLSPTEREVIREKVFSTSQHINFLAKKYFGSTFSNLLSVIGTTLTGVVYTLTGLVVVFYFLLDGHELKDGFISMLPRDSQPTAEHLLENLHNVMFGYVKGQVMLGMCTGLYMVIVYSIFGVPYALFLGAWFALAEILPVVGTWIGFTPGILVLLFLNPVKLLMVMGLVYVYQTIKDNLVAPKVLGHVVGLHPVIVIISLLICAKVAGLVGVLFAIPLASTINVLILYYQERSSSVITTASKS